jgi:ATP-dependent DNA ligase
VKLRPPPLNERKAKLARFLAASAAGIVFNEHTDRDGAVVFQHACGFGLESRAIVSKRLMVPCRPAPSRTGSGSMIPAPLRAEGKDR